MILKFITRKGQVLLVLIAYLSISIPCQAELTDIPDLSLRECLTNLAGKNNWKSPSDFTYINCHNSDIQNIEGIIKFVNITKLSLYKNKLTNVNVTGFSKLAHINFAGNQLIELNLSDLSSLEECYIFNNKIAKLSILNTPKLIKLKANNNIITDLRLVNTQALTKLYIFDNEIEKLDMETLPALSYLDARHNPMPDEFYDYLDSLESLTALHDGNAEDWQ